MELTENGWTQAIDFFSVQEFILLSDTLDVSMLVDAINHGFAKGITETTVLGPFYVQNPPKRPWATISAAPQRASRYTSMSPSYFTREGPGIAPDGEKIDTPWRRLHSDFVLAAPEKECSSGLRFARG